MRWIRTGRQIGQAVKNVQRLRQILGTLAKYGFVDIVERMNLSKFIPSRLTIFAQAQADNSTPERLRHVFEELGPTFVKLGQLLSTRSDLLPEAFIEEFTKLQDHVNALPFSVVKEAVERELGKPLTEAYRDFSEKPLAAASIGQVHEATLLTGERVVVKVQRPEIARIIHNDISLLGFLANLLEKYVPETRIVSPKIIVDEFFRTLSYELDFKVEANNVERMAQNLAIIPDIVIPKVYRELSTSRVLTLEKLDGIRVNDLKSLAEAGIDGKRVVAVGANAFFRSVMIDGLFHGDMHGGNLFILPGNKLGVIDFGIVGRLSQKSRDQLAAMVLALLTEDYENLCYLYAELGTNATSIDFDGFQREVRNTLAPYMGLALKDLNAGKILIEATKIATKYSIKVPGDWMIVFKAILTIEGMGRTLDPDFDLLATGQDMIREIVKNQFTVERVTKDLTWVAKDLAGLLQSLPRYARWALRRFAANDFALEVRSPGFDQLSDRMDQHGRRISSSILVAGMFVACSISLQHQSGAMVGGYPLLSVIFFVLGCFILMRVLWKSL